MNNEITGQEIAVIGMSGRFPGAKNIEQYWQIIKEGKDVITRFSDQELILEGLDNGEIDNSNYVKAKGILEGADMFDASLFGFTPREAEMLDPQQRVFLECSWEALENAGYDPKQFAGLIGAFAGASQNTYLLKNLMPKFGPKFLEGNQGFLANSANDFLTTLVSYKLDLRGPSFTVQTGCSTSLVAVHLACQSLLTRECDMALAGGVTIQVPLKSGYTYLPGGIRSKDGHCRAFDSKASGAVFGDGVGLVVLKRLEDAIEDRDHIWSLIKGSAINNDGSAKVGYTAPSVDGQARAILDALMIAGVNPETIKYVEAHGTGTKLGDPIEIAGLTQAYSNFTNCKEFCSIGSVKTNIGHLDAAAGIAGLIKTIMAIYYRQLPPSLYFKSPNPQINFKETPFVVSTKLHDWDSTKSPRRAGVSSFGVGGTNAHVILEEAPKIESEKSYKPWHLLTLSAQSKTALDKNAKDLVEFLKTHPNIDFADIAYTYQIGRRHLNERRMLICQDKDDAIRGLKDLRSHKIPKAKKKVVFMFPGQGAQYIGMCSEIYKNENLFKREFDRCAELISPLIGVDIKKFLQSNEGSHIAKRILTETYVAQPLLFALEYALYKQWREWGVKPDEIIGHSIGEYTAAFVAGVFDLEEAIKLVVARGKLMQSLPKGSMMSVVLCEEQAKRFENNGVCVAAVNSPNLCVLSGPVDAVDKVENLLVEQKVIHRALNTSHAFHSSMVSPVLNDFLKELGKITFRKPTIKWISNVTGTWITESEATDPTYWVKHLRETVQFSKGIKELIKNPDTIFLEVGPGETLGIFVKDHSSGHTVISTVPHINNNIPEYKFVLNAIGTMWLEGCDINWLSMYKQERRKRLPLPTYSFDHRRYWIESKTNYKVDFESTTDPYTMTCNYHSGLSQQLNDQSSESEANSAEEVIKNVWHKFLGVRPKSVDDNFFELGGHSLVGIQVISKLSNIFKVELSLEDLSKNPTVSKLANAITHGHGYDTSQQNFSYSSEKESELENLNGSFPMTDLAQAYWLGRKETFERGNIGSHIYYEIECLDLDIERLNGSWQKLINRHPMLRSVVLPHGEQKIIKEVPPYIIEVIDLRMRSKSIVKKELTEMRNSICYKASDPEKWPYFEIKVSVLDQSFIVHIKLDYLIVDAMSIEILNREWSQLYQNPDTVLSSLQFPYKNYMDLLTDFENSPEYKYSYEYWWNRLSRIPPGPRLPLVRKTENSSVGISKLVSKRGKLDFKSWNMLKKRASKIGVTPSGIVCAIFAEVIGTWSEGQRFTLNLPIFNRIEFNPQVNDIVGSFTSTSLLEIDLCSNEKFIDRIQRVQHQIWKDLDHRYVSGVKVTRELARKLGTTTSSLMPIVFTGFTSTEIKKNKPTFMEWLGKEHFISNQTPQTLLDHQIGEDHQGNLTLCWDVLEEEFPSGLVDDMFQTYCLLLYNLANNDTPWEEIRPVKIPEVQIRQRDQINNTFSPLGSELIHELFAQQANTRPYQQAIVSRGTSVDYRRLDSLSNKIGNVLRSFGITPNKLVGVLMERGWEQVAAILGILKAGAAYLPIDPSLPMGRIVELIESGEVQHILVNATVEKKLECLHPVNIFTVSEEALDSFDDSPLVSIQNVDDLAYVIFTSGSTGSPKGVMIDHKGAINTIKDINSRFNIKETDRILALSSLSFDLSVYDILGVLSAGGTIVMPDPLKSKEPEHWIELITKERVTLWNSVPSLLQMLLDHADNNPVSVLPNNLRLVLLSGDWIPIDMPDRIRELFRSAKIISLGGATEASIWSIYYLIDQIEEMWRSIPYGQPLKNQHVYILDEALCLRPTWVAGEIFIGGIGVSKGYWKDAIKTSERFLTSPSGELLYRTGDLGRYLEDGNIELLGRIDNQVKINGYRIELGEIEATIKRQSEVSEVIVLAREDNPGHKQLVAYIKPERGQTISIEVLQQYLRQTLPEYMIPSSMVFISELPLTPNGKIDRRALPVPNITNYNRTKFIKPQNKIQEDIIKIWCKVLGVEGVSITDNFFRLNGNSLLAVRVISEIRNVFEVDIPLSKLFENPTVEQLANVINKLKLDREQTYKRINQLLNRINNISDDDIKNILSGNSD